MMKFLSAIVLHIGCCAWALAEPVVNTTAHAEQRLNAFGCEPSVGEVIASWQKYASMHETTWKTMRSRARNAAWLPQVRWSMRYGRGVDWRLHADDQARWNHGNDLTLTGGLWFQLDRLIYSSDEVDVLREQRMYQENQQTRLQALIKLYFERRRLLAEYLQNGLVQIRDMPLPTVLRIKEIEAHVDALTGRVFARRWACALRR